jgi:hypothetical protein
MLSRLVSANPPPADEFGELLSGSGLLMDVGQNGRLRRFGLLSVSETQCGAPL